MKKARKKTPKTLDGITPKVGMTLWWPGGLHCEKVARIQNGVVYSGYQATRFPKGLPVGSLYGNAQTMETERRR